MIRDDETKAVLARLDEITAAVKSRLRTEYGLSFGSMGGTEIDFMTPGELAERHELMMKLPSFAEERFMAKERVARRVAERKAHRQNRAAVQNLDNGPFAGDAV